MKLAFCLLLLLAVYKNNAEVTVSCDLVRCPGNHTCKLKPVISCTKDQDCQTVNSPVCVADIKDGICPVQDLTEIAESNCKIDSDCEGNLKCCPHKKNSFCFKPCRKMMCKCSADSTLVYVNNSKGCPVCTCVNLEEKENDADCSLPKEVGQCRAHLSRYYFNSSTKVCEKFYYGGCSGNSNNFFTKLACENKCLPKSPISSKNLDKCSQPVKQGMCKGNIERFFYNTTSHSCEKFIYGGCQSNENNFVTLASCNEQCNNSTLNRVSLPIEQQVCHLDTQPGPCFASFIKYSFNKATNKCEKFTYGGCGGNANRFDTRSECEKACPKNETVPIKQPVADKICSLEKQTGSCRGYFERYFYNDATGHCELFIYGGCEGNQNNFQTKEQCENKCKSSVLEIITLAPAAFIEEKSPNKSFNPQSCGLKKDSGPCLAYFESYFFNADTQKCEQFIYGGCKGNENRFQTIEECESSCKNTIGLNPIQVNQPFDKNVCKLKKDTGPCLAFFERFAFNSDTAKCEQFIYGGCQGNGNRFLTEEECQDLCGNVSNDKEDFEEASCYLPSDSGLCEAYIRSYFYNKESKKCEQFIYGGCGGNGNRFMSAELCEKSCANVHQRLVSSVNKCELNVDAGLCRGYFEKFYYDKTAKTCKEFIYGGCGGNLNNFESLEECNSECLTKQDTQKVDLCTLPAQTGKCRAMIERYFFDSETKKCQMFVYGGCEGNANNFESLAECQSSCLSAKV